MRAAVTDSLLPELRQYEAFLSALKNRIRAAQVKTAIAFFIITRRLER